MVNLGDLLLKGYSLFVVTRALGISRLEKKARKFSESGRNFEIHLLGNIVLRVAGIFANIKIEYSACINLQL